MPRRTVTATRLWATTRRRMDETQDLSRLAGAHDVLHLAHAFFAGIPPQDLIDHSKERYVAIEKMVPTGRTLLLELSVGIFGDSGPTRDVMTGKTEHTRGRHHSPASTVRALVAIPQRATSALIFLEHAGGNSASWALITPLKLWLRKRFPDYTWSSETLVETDAWMEAAQLTAVSAVLHGHSPNIEDADVPKVIGKLEHVLTPEGGGKFFPRALWDALHAGRIKRAELFGLEDSEVDDVFVRMEKDGRSKKFALGYTGSPLAKWVLSDAGDAEPSTEAARDFFFELAPDLFTAVGVDWQSEDRYGDWPQEVLSLKLEEDS